jgi:hypothetical protein
MGRRGRRCKHVLDAVKEKSGCWNLREETPDRTMWRTLWKRLWTCRKTDYVMNESVNCR